MPMFTRGDAVMLSNHGESSYNEEPQYNPPNVIGEYRYDDGDGEGDCPHNVQWPTQGDNFYNLEDLIPAPPQ